MEVLGGVGVGLLRILGVGVRIFDPTPTPKVQFSYFQHAFPVYFYLLHKQAVHGLFGKVLPMLLSYFLASFYYFVKKSIFFFFFFFHPLNRNDDLKELELES